MGMTVEERENERDKKYNKIIEFAQSKGINGVTSEEVANLMGIKPEYASTQFLAQMTQNGMLDKKQDSRKECAIWTASSRILAQGAWRNQTSGVRIGLHDPGQFTALKNDCPK